MSTFHHSNDLGTKEVFATEIGTNYASNTEGRLGQIRITDDGRKFRWVKAADAITKGYVVCSPPTDTDHLVTATTVTTASAIGSYDVYSTVSTTAGYGPGDYLFFTTGTTIYGSMYEIDHVVAATQIKLTTALATATLTTSEFTIWRPWVVTPTGTTITEAAVPVGIAQQAVTTASPYFWVQTFGPGIAVGDASAQAVVPGEPVVASGVASGGGMICGLEDGTTTTPSKRIVGLGIVDPVADIPVPVYITIDG
jgi:hypothetical protein